MFLQLLTLMYRVPEENNRLDNQTSDKQKSKLSILHSLNSSQLSLNFNMIKTSFIFWTVYRCSTLRMLFKIILTMNGLKLDSNLGLSETLYLQNQASLKRRLVYEASKPHGQTKRHGQNYMNLLHLKWHTKSVNGQCLYVQVILFWCQLRLNKSHNWEWEDY